LNVGPTREEIDPVRSSRLIPLAAAPLALAALVGLATPAGAIISTNGTQMNGVQINGVQVNGIHVNALVDNALAPNALSATGATLDQLDGVSVEAVELPDTTRSGSP
jgi:hypothetical protein